MSEPARLVPISRKEAEALHEHGERLATQRIRASDGRRPPGPGESIVQALVDRYERAEGAAQAVEDLARALDGCLWVLNNRHNAGSAAFEEYAVAAETDARAARGAYTEAVEPEAGDG